MTAAMKAVRMAELTVLFLAVKSAAYNNNENDTMTKISFKLTL